MKERPQFSMEERIAQVIKALHTAFEDCDRPGTDDEYYGVGGLEWGDMRKHWIPRTREEVEAAEEFDIFRYSDDLDVMSTTARRYFIPAIMVWILTHPLALGGLEFDSFIYQLGKMWVEEETYKYSRATSLTMKQVAAIEGWCSLLLDGALQLGNEDDFGGDSISRREEKLRQKLTQLSECLPKAVKLTDYDQAQKDERAKANTGWRFSQRKGWKRFKGREGKRPGK